MQTLTQRELPRKDERLEVIQRIISSSHFSRSPRLVDFFTYICDRTLNGRAEEICEQQIGVEVFKRPSDYNPNDDSIVRSHARLLRQKLAAYFDQEGQVERIRIRIPKGHYVPCFEPLELKVVGLSSADVDEASCPAAQSHVRWLIWCSCAFSLFALVLAAYWSWLGPKTRITPHVFWKTFFSSGNEVLIVPADSALALLEDITQRRIGLADYVNHRYHLEVATAPGWNVTALSNLASRQYTSMADLELASRLVRLPEARSRPIRTRYARSLQLAELKEATVVLIGGPLANPWEDLFQDKMNFFLDSNLSTSENRVGNKHPRSGEQAFYREVKGDSPIRAYGIVALLPGLRATTRTLVVEGTSSTGTECAADFLLDEAALGNFLVEISKRGESSREGVLPFFEVLLQSAAVAGSAPQPEIVAYRIIRN